MDLHEIIGIRIIYENSLNGILFMEKLINLFKKRGVFNTFKILSQFDNFRADKHMFYQKLNEFSNYNSFLRVKKDLIAKELLAITKSNGVCNFELTSKGKKMFFILKELNELLEET